MIHILNVTTTADDPLLTVLLAGPTKLSEKLNLENIMFWTQTEPNAF